MVDKLKPSIGQDPTLEEETSKASEESPSLVPQENTQEDASLAQVSAGNQTGAFDPEKTDEQDFSEDPYNTVKAGSDAATDAFNRESEQIDAEPSQEGRDPFGASRSLAQLSADREVGNSTDAEISELEKELGMDEETLQEEQDAESPEKEGDYNAELEKLAKAEDDRIAAKNGADDEGSATLRVIGGAVLDTVQEAVNLGFDIVNWTDDTFEALGFGDGKDVISEENYATFAERLIPSKGPIESAARGILGFVIPYAGALKAAKGIRTASKLARAAKLAGVGAIVDFAVIDPKEKRLSDFLQRNTSFNIPLLSYLESDKEDSRLEGRFKNAIEGVTIGLGFDAAEGLWRVAKQYKAGRKLKKAVGSIDETAEQLDAALKVDITKTEKKPLREGSKINLEQLKNQKDVEDLVNSYVEGPISKQKRGVLTQEDVAGLADKLGTTEADLLARKPGDAWTIEQIKGSESVIEDSAQSIIDVAKQWDKLDIDSQAQAILNMEKFVNLVAAVKGAKSEAARALGMGAKVTDNITSEVAKRRMAVNIVGQLGDVESATSLMGMIQKMKAKDLSQVATLKEAGKPWKEAIISVRTNGLLSGFTTHAANAIGNTGVIVGSIAERGFGRLRTKIRGGSGADAVAAGEVQAMLSGSLEGMKDGFVLAKKAFAEGVPQSKTKLDKVRRGVITAENFQAEGWVGSTVDILGKINEWPGRLLMASDEFFKTVNSRMETHALVTRELSSNPKFKNLSTEALQAEYDKIVGDPIKHAPFIEKRAQDFAEKNTFTNPIESSFKNVDEFVNKSPMLRLLFPFTKTTINIVEFGVERTPLLNKALKRVRDDLAAGGVRRDMAKAKTDFGASVMAISGSFAAAGLITGEGPSNFKARSILMDAGWQPNSVKLGDDWVQYSRLEPFGKLIGLSADLMEIGGQLFGDDVNKGHFENLAGASAALVGNYLMPEFLTDGTADLVDLMSKPSFRSLKNVIAKQPSTFIPLSGLLRGIRKEIDPIKRSVKADKPRSEMEKEFNGVFEILQESVNRIKATIPGMSSSLPVTRDLFGNERVYTPGFGPDIASPIATSTENQDAVWQELIRLNMAAPFVEQEPDPSNAPFTITMPPSTVFKGVGGGATVPIRLNHQEYDRFVRLSAGLDGGDVGGLSLKEFLSEEVEAGYPSLPTDIEGGVTDEMRKIFLSEAIQAYRSQALDILMTERENLQEEFEEAVDKRAQSLGL